MAQYLTLIDTGTLKAFGKIIERKEMKSSLSEMFTKIGEGISLICVCFETCSLFEGNQLKEIVSFENTEEDACLYKECLSIRGYLFFTIPRKKIESFLME